MLNDLSKNLFIKFIQHSINFDKKEICAVIALDLCRTIDKNFKLFHTLIATAMANYFNGIEIPYSIIVFCDYGVQFIIKDFEHPLYYPKEWDDEIYNLVYGRKENDSNRT